MFLVKMNKVFPVIVTYKGHRWYERCFNSLRQSTISVQTIVVDNASNDGTVEYIKEHYPEIHLIESKENLGFGKANNIAMRYALDQGCDYVFLLNQDAWVEPVTLEKLVDIHQRHPEYGIVAPLQVDKEKEKVLFGLVDFLTYPGKINRQLISDLLLHKEDEIYAVGEVNAAAWLLPRNTLKTIGGFDPLFLHYGEDWKYLSRVLYHKLKVGIAPHLTVVHDCKERVEREKGYNATFDKWLLQRATDILYPETQVEDMMRHYQRVALMKLFTLHKATFKENWEAYRYLKKNKALIEQSREQNKKVAASWL